MNSDREQRQLKKLTGVAEVARGIALWRERRGLTIEQLAQRSGFPSTVLSAIEAEQHDPDIQLLDRLVRVLGVRLIDLFEVGDLRIIGLQSVDKSTDL
ncbi:helix-turn-helix transcriptional regulator [Pleomorphomonas sp. NRK KF1]|uniref:helix-turn-helix transcriptional regulator n=1 Tax=Pleomorphomonas sp. NRK KF1 TaxID=2943000 RepID=UPI003530892C